MPALAAVPAFIALLFKLGLLAFAIRSPHRNAVTRLFVLFLGLLSVYNVVEVMGLSHFATHGLDGTMERYGFTYFACVIVYTAVMLHLALRISVDEWKRVRPIVPVIYAPALLLEILLLGTDKLVAGFQLFQNYSVLRVPGPLYSLFEVYMLVYILAALVYLVYGARRSRPSRINRARNRWWLFALIPFVLLHIYLIVANHFGLAKISSTVSVPIALTIFLAITTYATHQYRLFDITFFLPWSKVRKRKTAFYQRIRTTIAGIAEVHTVRQVLDALANTLRCQVALIGGLRPVVALVPGRERQEELRISEFPKEALQPINQIVVAEEIADSQPNLYSLMKRYRVGAIVPFASHGVTSGNWMLFGERFSENVYTPLDFKLVEHLLARIGELFIDDLLLVRSQLADARREIEEYRDKLARAWTQVDEQHKLTARLMSDNAELRETTWRSRRERIRVVAGGIVDKLPREIATGELTLESYLERYKAQLLRTALKAAKGDKHKAARLLGIVGNRELQYLLERHDVDPKNYE